MRRPLLLPYAVVAALIVLASSAAVLATVRPNGPATDDATVAAQASASHAAPELSRSSRLAYWRDKRLWVSNLDGSLRYPIASVDDVRRVSLTRWSSDGSAVAYVDSGATLFVVPTQGDAIAVPLPRTLGGSGYQIKDLRWSPDGTRVAATILRPQDGRSDAYVVDLSAGARTWTRITRMEDLFIGDWISDGEMLGYTAGGAIVVIPATENGTVRLLTGAVGVSPVIGPDGRIHYLVGRVPISRDPSFPFQTAMRASVWSAATDGSDARRETTWELNDLRLDARLPDGRYLVHRGASNALGAVTDDVALLPSAAGVVERVRIAPDGRTAYGFTSDKIVRIDLTKLVAAPAATPIGSITVFLDISGDADVWFPSPLSLARGDARPPAAPSARYAFALGGHLWQMQKGVATLLVSGPPFRRPATPPLKWSPDGDHILVVGQAGQGLRFALEASLVDRSGNTKAIPGTTGAGRSYAWSPSGSEVAVVVDRRGQNGTFSDAQLEVRFFDPTGRATRAPVAGTEVAWTARGLYLLDDAGAPSGQALRRLDGDAGARTLVTRDRLAADPRAALGRQPLLRETPALSGLEASPDGSFVTLRLEIGSPASTRAYLAILDSEGAPLQLIRVDDLSDVAWSPKSTLLGYTSGVRGGTERAFVISPAGATVAAEAGRFAGWTPDGQWYLIGRAGSLYAYPVAGGAPVRLGPASAPVSAAASR